MNEVQSRLESNINSLLMMLSAKGVEKVSLPKLVLFVNREFNVEMDENGLSDIISKNTFVKSIQDNYVHFDEDTEGEINDDIHDKATDQASDNLTSESVNLKDNVKIYENLNIGMELSAKDIKLDENDEYYFLHLGARKTDSKYIITDFLPSNNLTESKVRCKIKDKCIFIEIPASKI